MNELWNQLFLQMVADTLRIIMLLYGLCVVAVVYMITDKILKFTIAMIGRGCKAIWNLIKRVWNKKITVVTEQVNAEEV